MYNLIVLASKPSAWTHEHFIEWWRGEHAEVTYPLPGLRRWLHTEVLEGMSGERSDGWDGLSVLSFDSKEALETALASDEWQRAVAHVGSMGGRSIIVTGDEMVMVPEARV
ncbi:EthD family reductase [Nocardioides bizhenqiangii]|uniref:EthD family reductase n=1 Tax=Nocardioides bizhenqiangii TaxID=3095076 RepID=A0ABZ0ZXP3_9ACTN|nr:MULTISPECIES: EthD family reductase [unclassified Nocardioides]MDZ5622385.1 EthD family reductase [Nocardioides sp. HM23]WQQ28446.1 EthD family reductase [Nocardioides sp. HM61]